MFAVLGVHPRVGATLGHFALQLVRTPVGYLLADGLGVLRFQFLGIHRLLNASDVADCRHAELASPRVEHDDVTIAVLQVYFIISSQGDLAVGDIHLAHAAVRSLDQGTRLPVGLTVHHRVTHGNLTVDVVLGTLHRAVIRRSRIDVLQHSSAPVLIQRRKPAGRIVAMVQALRVALCETVALQLHPGIPQPLADTLQTVTQIHRIITIGILL